VKLNELFRPAVWNYAVQRLCTWYPLRRLLSAIIAATKPSHQGGGSASEKVDKLVQDIRQDGIAFLPGFVAPDTIARIKAHLQGASLRERFPPCRTNFTIENVPTNVHVAEYSTEHVVRSPDVLALANHPRLVDAAGRYLGCKPTISNIGIWWSLPADGTAQEAENYHRDVDDWRFVKFFLYLTDVDEAAGPHCFVRGSHRSTRFLRIRRIKDEEVTKIFPKGAQLHHVGKSGYAFMEETYCLHKGQPPIGGRRLLLQVEYSVNPIAVYKYRPSSLSFENPTIDPYVNRLFLA
jgi:hypothetical protein